MRRAEPDQLDVPDVPEARAEAAETLSAPLVKDGPHTEAARLDEAEGNKLWCGRGGSAMEYSGEGEKHSRLNEVRKYLIIVTRA
jgi:hypothetical protein